MDLSDSPLARAEEAVPDPGPPPPPPAAATAAETELDTALAAGDRRRAITVLMRAHGDALYRYIRQMVRHDALADDVHQQVFIEAYRDLDRFERRASARTWLYSIARHRCLDALKGERRRAAHGTEPPEHEPPDPAPAAGERLDNHRIAGALDECLGELAPTVRTAVLLRYQEGFSYEEMARICRDKPGTLGARVARALPVLRRCIEARTGGLP